MRCSGQSVINLHWDSGKLHVHGPLEVTVSTELQCQMSNANSHEVHKAWLFKLKRLFLKKARKCLEVGRMKK